MFFSKEEHKGYSLMWPWKAKCGKTANWRCQDIIRTFQSVAFKITERVASNEESYGHEAVWRKARGIVMVLKAATWPMSAELSKWTWSVKQQDPDGGQAGRCQMNSTCYWEQRNKWWFHSFLEEGVNTLCNTSKAWYITVLFVLIRHGSLIIMDLFFNLFMSFEKNHRGLKKNYL